MRWPLRRQILVPMAAIVLATVGVTTLVAVLVAIGQVESRVERQLADVQATLSAANFPLESNVLRQTRGLTGADFVLVDLHGRLRGTSRDDLVPLAAGPAAPAGLAAPALDLSRANVVAAGPHRYLHTVLPIDRRPVGGDQSLLHVFYPESAWREAWRQAAWPPLVLGAIATALVALAAGVVAWQVATPIHQLQTQVRRLTEGDFQAVSLPRRNDEVRDLAQSINQLAERLARYEEETRASERLKTLGTLGGGIAHQIRNAATGCRIALDLHARDCPLARSGEGDESLRVAARQLTLIESHIQRFLTLGRPAARIHQPVDLADVVRQAAALVEPTATHLGVALRTETPAGPIRRAADAEGLVQMLVNLIVNAVEATSGARASAGGKMSPAAGEVVVRLSAAEQSAARRACLSVSDEGPGPSAIIAGRLFEPFATDKPGGTGLGLVVARQIAAEHGGAIAWERRGGQTQFVVDIPLEQGGEA